MNGRNGASQILGERRFGHFEQRTAPVELYVNAEGDAVPWDELTEIERKYYSPSGQAAAVEWGLTVREYVAKMEVEEYLAELCEGDSGG